MKQEQLEKLENRLKEQLYTPKQLKAGGIEVNEDGNKRNLYQVLSFPNVKFDDLVVFDAELSGYPPSISEQICRDALYLNYVIRQKRDVESLKKDEDQIIPKDFDYIALDGLSNELKAKLEAVYPRDLGQAMRIDGMTPAAALLILGKIKDPRRAEST